MIERDENGARKGVEHHILLADIKIDCSILVVNSFEYDILSGLNHRAAIHLYRSVQFYCRTSFVPSPHTQSAPLRLTFPPFRTFILT